MGSRWCFFWRGGCVLVDGVGGGAGWGSRGWLVVGSLDLFCSSLLFHVYLWG